jgi:hypothetical protein
LIGWFFPLVGRHLVRILSPDFSSGCLGKPGKYIVDGFIGVYLISLQYAKMQTYNFVVRQ